MKLLIVRVVVESIESWQLLILAMNQVEIQHLGVLVGAIDTELKNLSIWTIPGA